MSARSTALAAAPLAAQSAPADPMPACADLGPSRLAVTVPPGQTRDELVAALRQGGVLPAGTEVHPASGHRDVDPALRDLWRHARFAPVQVRGCRAPAWLHVSIAFVSHFSEDGRQIEIRYQGIGMGPGAPPADG